MSNLALSSHGQSFFFSLSQFKGEDLLFSSVQDSFVLWNSCLHELVWEMANANFKAVTAHVWKKQTEAPTMQHLACFRSRFLQDNKSSKFNVKGKFRSSTSWRYMKDIERSSQAWRKKNCSGKGLWAAGRIITLRDGSVAGMAKDSNTWPSSGDHCGAATSTPPGAGTGGGCAGVSVSCSVTGHVQ